MKQIAIATVHHGPKWLVTQSRFIQANTDGYSLCIVANENPETYGVKAEWIDRGRQRRHRQGLRRAVAWLMAQDAEFLCILDSDAFPVHPGWVERLAKVVGPAGDRKFAAPVRVEVGQLFPHPCCIFTHRKNAVVLARAWSDAIVLDVFGRKVRGDCGSGMPIVDCFPMLRTNAVNVDPVLHGVYYDCVYHAAAGSRPRHTIADDYYGKVDLVNSGAAFIHPDEIFINKLLGRPRFSVWANAQK